MAYNKTTWQTGDTITADKLNNLENGVSGGENFILNITPAMDEQTQEITATADKSLSDVLDALASDKNVIVKMPADAEGSETYIIPCIEYSTSAENGYAVFRLAEMSIFSASSPSGLVPKLDIFMIGITYRSDGIIIDFNHGTTDITVD